MKHEEYNGADTAKVAFCLSRKNQDKLPPWKGETAPTHIPNAYGGTDNAKFTEIKDEDLPF